MNCSIRLFSVFLFFIVSIVVQGQSSVPEYTVQVGSFVNPKPADFIDLSTHGFVYAVQRSSSHTDVFVGGFTSENAAQAVASLLKESNYSNAFVSKLNTEGGEPVTMIQLATHTAGDAIKWSELMEAGPLSTLLNGKQVKILTGPFEDPVAAKTVLPKIRELGFDDAFVKNVNNALLHEVTTFETGGIVKKPLIPLDFTEKEMLADATSSPTTEMVPEPYEEESILVPAAEEVAMTAKGATPKPEVAKAVPKATAAAFDFEATMPDIRANVKRSSVLDLQEVLKEQGAYRGSLDGYYGKNTESAYRQVSTANRQLQKYAILAQYMTLPGAEASAGSVQHYINQLWEEPQAAMDGLRSSQAPIAKAYRAYFHFVNEGAGPHVNNLMNKAINEVFHNRQNVDLPRFDPAATYAYHDLSQLLLHLRYLHESIPGKPAVPCWLFRRHPGIALEAFESSENSGLNLQNCGGFWDWKEIQVLYAIANDVGTEGRSSEAILADGHSNLARLFLTPQPLPYKERKSLEAWNEKLWKGVEGWSVRDPFLSEIVTALQLSYFQSQVLLEDFYMNEGFSELEAKGLALAALHALVGHQLNRFV